MPFQFHRNPPLSIFTPFIHIHPLIDPSQYTSPFSHSLPSNYDTILLTHHDPLTLPLLPTLSPHTPNSFHTLTSSSHHRHHRHHHQLTLLTKHHSKSFQCILPPYTTSLPQNSQKLTQTHPLSPMFPTLSPHPHTLPHFQHFISPHPFILNL